MFELIEIELTRVRRMAEPTGDGFLLYLIDIAILQANAKARSAAGAPEAPSAGPPTPGDCDDASRVRKALQAAS